MADREKINLTITRRFALLLAILSLALTGILAQTDTEPLPIEMGEARVVRLPGDENPALLTFAGRAGDAVTITVRSVVADDERDPLDDPVVALIGPDGRWLAYNDDYGTAADLLPTDARIRDLTLPQTGTYTIQASTYGGIYPGQVEVTLEPGDPFAAQTTGQPGELLTISGWLPQSRAYTTTITAQAGDTLTITGRAARQPLDPALILTNADGDRLAFNDDHGTQDLTLAPFDARIERFTIPAEGVYTVTLLDVLGRAGRFTLVIEWV